jgi:hypothetical protein
LPYMFYSHQANVVKSFIVQGPVSHHFIFILSYVFAQ